jgi:cysteine desulfurase NifS/selenium donor protein
MPSALSEQPKKTNEMNPVYLDYNATTPMDPLVIDAIRPYLEQYFGNPSSMHAYGVSAKLAVEKARKQVALLLNAHPDEIVFTSGGTESNNFAIKGAAFVSRSKGNHIITSSIEHPAVTEVCHFLEKFGFNITWLPVDASGMVDAADVRRAITPQTVLITVMHANNETGTIQPVDEIGSLAREHNILFHCDAAQSVGKIPVNVRKSGIDLLSVAGHKLYAPKGVGVLYIRRGVKLEKLMHGADHESNLRAGTENVMEIAGLGMAAELAMDALRHNTPSIMKDLRDKLHRGILDDIPEVRLNGHPERRLPNTLSLGFPGVEAALMLDEMKGLAASAGAACHADQAEVSGVLSAMNVPWEYAIGTIRFSVGRMSSAEEIEEAIPIIVNAYNRLKGRGERANYELRITNDELGFAGDRVEERRVEIEMESAEYQVLDDNYQVLDANYHMQGAGVEIRLTEYTHALGCACKIRPQLLEKILSGLPGKNNPAILVGHETSDDAAVYQVNETTAIVQTVDFIPPVVDDPYMYGAISAANALSDVYAMGGKPVFALSIVGFPDRKLPMEVLEQILKGANDKVAEAGIQVIGGHSIEDSEPKFGLVVTGLVHPGSILRNSGAQPGDRLILTKPIGTGIITTAIKRGLASETATSQVMQVMAELNRVAAEVMIGFGVNACTDVTGFGLLGHLKEMVEGAGVQAVLNIADIPVMDAAWEYAAAGAIPGGTKNNLDYVKRVIRWSPETPELMKFILADAQTSGGLLISVPADNASALLAGLKAKGITAAAIIGSIAAGKPLIIA